MIATVSNELIILIVYMKQECPTLFSEIIQPSSKIKDAWRKMIPGWAWDAMVEDTGKILKIELPRKTAPKDIERRIKNRHVFIKREAFFPESFLPDVVKDACLKYKKNNGDI